MNNSFLKKASAVALAAVMAVTFAPAASLDVFAKNTEVDSGKITGNAVIEDAGTYTITDSTTGTSITFEKGGPYILDVADQNGNKSGHPIAVNVKNGADLTIVDSLTASPSAKAAGKLGTITVGTDPTGTKDDPATLTVNGGNMAGIEIQYGDVTINDGNSIGKITAKTGHTLADKDGDAHTAGDIFGSTLTINGGNITKFVHEDATAAGTGSANVEILKTMTVNGGVFAQTDGLLGNILYKDKDSKGSDGPNKAGVDTKTPVVLFAKQGKIFSAAAGYAVGDRTIAGCIANNDDGKDLHSDITVQQGAVALTEVPDGTKATIAIDTNNGTVAEKDKDKSLTVAGKEGLSVLKVDDKTTNSAKYYTTTTTYYVGNKAIDPAANKGIGIKEGKLQDNAKFTNGGSTLEVDVDGADYIAYEPAIERAAATGKVITVKALTKDKETKALVLGNYSDYKVPADAKVVADAAYTVASTNSDDGRYVVVTDAPQIAVDTTTGDSIVLYTGKVKDTQSKDVKTISVEQIGTTEGLLFLTNVPYKATVSADKSVAMGYNVGEDGVTYYVGEDALQYASNSREGKKIAAKATAAKKSGYVSQVPTYGNLTFTQGAFTLNEVALMNDTYGFSPNVDDDETKIDFIDGANLGMVKTVNYTNSVFGVKVATSANITVGSGIETVSLSRFYNKITGEHFYTSNVKEIADLNGSLGQANGWVNETEDKNTFKVLPDTASDGVTVYRLHNNFTGEHLFTADAKEKAAAIAANVGWEDEGVAFKAATEGTPVYRVKNPVNDAHLFTPDKAEVDYLAASEYKWELEGDNGIAFYGFE